MDSPSDSTEKRRYPRVLINLPVEFWTSDDWKVSPGLLQNASEAGFLIQTFKDMPSGTRINIKILFRVSLSKGVKSAKLRAVTDIAWKGVYWWEDWEGYQYGLRIIHLSDEDHLKLNLILKSLSNLEEVSIAEKSN
jgi:hypothetical protein